MADGDSGEAGDSFDADPGRADASFHIGGQIVGDQAVHLQRRLIEVPTGAHVQEHVEHCLPPVLRARHRAQRVGNLLQRLGQPHLPQGRWLTPAVESWELGQDPAGLEKMA